jgi:uncharacterized protein (DUF1810 family)
MGMRAPGQFDTDSYNLQRFIDAQNPQLEAVLSELRAGQKRTHWMWFIFPQLRGLGRSVMAYQYGICGLDEATAYLGHELLGPRLRQCTRLVTEVKGRSIAQIFGSPDDLKFRSCLTLFAHATSANEIFIAALQIYCAGEQDGLTLESLKQPPPAAP